MLKSIWRENAAVLSRVYPLADPCEKDEVARLATRGKAGGKRAAQARARWLSAYNMFFLSMVSVPPNRSRPPSRMGDLLYENAQNVALAQARNSSSRFYAFSLAHSPLQVQQLYSRSVSAPAQQSNNHRIPHPCPCCTSHRQPPACCLQQTCVSLIGLMGNNMIANRGGVIANPAPVEEGGF